MKAFESEDVVMSSRGKYFMLHICFLGDIRHSNVHSFKISKNDLYRGIFFFMLGVKYCEAIVAEGQGGR